MKLIGSLTLALALTNFHNGAYAATPPAEPPACGATCIQQEVVNSPCGLNVTCICTDVELNQKISLCVKASCTVREVVQSYSKHTCGAPSRDRTTLVRAIGISFLVLGLVGFGLRVMARVFVGTQSWGADDWVMLFAVVMMIALNGLCVKISRVGLGKDIWNVPPDDIADFLYLFFWDELLYLGALPLTKISILLCYLKVFPAKNTKIACWIFIGLNIAYLITFELISIFQCRPIAGAWKAWDGEFHAKCNNVNMQGWMAAILNIFLDLGTLIIPLGELYRLDLSIRKKLQLTMMFSVGIFVTIVSAVRLRSIALYATTSNITQDYVEVGYWSTIEVPVGIVCACMPAIRSLFSMVFPKVFASTNRSKTGYADMSNVAKPTLLSQKRQGFIAPHITVETEIIRYSRHQDECSIELSRMRRNGQVEGLWSIRKPAVPYEPV